MDRHEEFNILINTIIENVSPKEEISFCCGALGTYQVIETEKVKICFPTSNPKQCEVVRLKNNNPVIFRDDAGTIYRLHGEAEFLKAELHRLAKIPFDGKHFDYD